MAGRRRPFAELLAMGVIAGLVAFGLAVRDAPGAVTDARPRAAAPVDARAPSSSFIPPRRSSTVRSRDGARDRDLDLALVVDGVSRPLALARGDLRADGRRAPRDGAGADRRRDGRRRARAPRRSGARRARDRADRAPGAETAGHEFALRAELSSEGQVVFVPGVGPIADRATVSGGALVVDAEPHPIAIVSTAGPCLVDALRRGGVAPTGEPMRVSAASPARPPDGDRLAELHFVVGESSLVVWRELAELAGTPTAPVHGRVTGTGERALVFGRDAQGNPQVRALAAEGGAFALDVPPASWSGTRQSIPGRASGARARSSRARRATSSSTCRPAASCTWTIVDADTRKPLTARLLVRGIDGTVDPSFGPDYRASGAGPVIDALRGDVTTPLPAGRYRVAATKGIEWSIDAKVVDIAPGARPRSSSRRVTSCRRPASSAATCTSTRARASTRRSRPRTASSPSSRPASTSPCRPSTTSSATTRRRSRRSICASELLTVTGVEVTTYSKGFGHFGVFPYPPARPVPPFKHTNMAAIFRAVRAGDPDRYFQLNHPRLPKGIGYFANIGFDPNGPRTRIRNRIDFDGIEVYNGYDIERPERVERCSATTGRCSTSAGATRRRGAATRTASSTTGPGYPRTMVTVDPHAHGDDEGAPRRSARRGRAASRRGTRPSRAGRSSSSTLGGRAARRRGRRRPTDPSRPPPRPRGAVGRRRPSVEIVVGQIGSGTRSSQSFDVPSRPTQIGPEPGTLAEAQERTIRFDRDLDVAVGPGQRLGPGRRARQPPHGRRPALHARPADGLHEPRVRRPPPDPRRRTRRSGARVPRRHVSPRAVRVVRASTLAHGAP